MRAYTHMWLISSQMGGLALLFRRKFRCDLGQQLLDSMEGPRIIGVNTRPTNWVDLSGQAAFLIRRDPSRLLDGFPTNGQICPDIWTGSSRHNFPPRIASKSYFCRLYTI